jgi:cation:H+ antiporter
MPDPMDALFLIGGLVLLTAGAESLVRGASRLADAIGISPLVIGLTVVAFGTSAPEMAVSTVSSMTGDSGIAVGNVIGSNIFNILAILGLSALITPLVVQQQLIRLDVPLMLAVSVATWWMALDGRIARTEGLLLFAGVVVYTVFLIMKSRGENRTIEEEYAKAYSGQHARRAFSLTTNIAFIAVGLGLLVLGSRWLVQGAVSIATRLGVSELVIGLTVVAAGTSLPELATSVVASIRGERDIAVGNVIGSNLFNLMAVLGVAAIVGSDGAPVSSASLHVDLPVMVLAAAACLPIFLTGHRISRGEGLLFFASYAAYITYIVLAETGGIS